MYEQVGLFAPDTPLPPPAPPLSRPDAPAVKLARVASDTSAAAAAMVLPKTGTQRMRVLEAIRRAGADGRTDAELEVDLRLSGNSVRPRRGELVDGGWVEDSGQRRECGHSGPGIVWRLTGTAAETLATDAG